jgi:hypothetical protein
VVVGAVLAVAGLAGCKTNVGTAAVIDGHRVTESDVNSYLTAGSQPVSQRDPATGATVQISPRSFVVSELINEKLGFKILKAIPSISNVTQTQLEAKLHDDLAGKSVSQVAEQLGLHGYTTAFYEIILRVQEISGLLRTAQSNGVDVSAVFSKISLPVSVSPRYGHWDSVNLRFTSGATVPGYLDVRPGPAAPQGPTGNN